MIIAHISDTHIDPDHIDCIKRLEDVKRVVATINALDPLPNVVISAVFPLPRLVP